MEAYQTEIFGPVMCVVNVDTIDDAIELVNSKFIQGRPGLEP